MCLKDVLAAFGFVKVESEADRSGDAGHSQAMTSSGTVSGRGRVRFRAIGTIVLAVKRFQASLNPTVDFHSSRWSAEDSMYVPPQTLEAQRSISAPLPQYHRSTSSIGSWRASSQVPGGRDTNLHQRRTHTHRGHITSYLVKPLPKIESEA